MRDDLLALEPRDVAWVVAALERLERMAAVHGRVLDPSVGRVKQQLAATLLAFPLA